MAVNSIAATFVIMFLPFISSNRFRSCACGRRRKSRERTALKLEHARKSGRRFGRPAKLNADEAALARRMKANGETAATICRTLGIGGTTLYRYLTESGED
jgi:DNA invertase Pin-like site-specific DNA recombinase